MIVIKGHTAHEVYLDLVWLYSTFKEKDYKEVGIDLPSWDEFRRLESKLDKNKKFKMFNKFVLVT